MPVVRMPNRKRQKNNRQMGIKKLDANYSPVEEEVEAVEEAVQVVEEEMAEEVVEEVTEVEETPEDDSEDESVDDEEEDEPDNYYCGECESDHRYSSKIGKRHAEHAE